MPDDAESSKGNTSLGGSLPNDGYPPLAASVSADATSVYQNQQSDDGANNNRHSRMSTWSGSFAEMFETDSSHQSASLAKPPTATRRRSLDQDRQTYHDRNQKFLEQANREKCKSLQSPKTRAMMSPSGSKSRKRLESIEEWQPNTAIPASSAQEGFMNHIRMNSDEMSVLSGASSWSHGSASAASGLGKSQIERLVQFEQDQQEQFVETKDQLEKKLHRALDLDGGKMLSEKQKQEFVQKYMQELERERETLLAQWKAEFEAERQKIHKEEQPPSLNIFYKTTVEPCLESLVSLLATVEVFLANLPLTIGAIGLSWVTMGTVWFKFMEEMVDFCTPAHFYSPRCRFPEFPGCFECDVENPTYQLVAKFHCFCSTFAGLCCVLFVLKVLVAWKVVADELSNPTTSTPMGVVCIAMVCVFAGRGVIGEAIVIGISIFHFFLAFWFLYMAVFKFGLWPDPGWFPNTVGLTYAAVKSFLYFPRVGLFFLCVSVVFFFSVFFVSVVRVALNRKIAAPVAWIGLSAPSITMYALTLVAQPTRHKEELLEHDSLFQLQNHDWMVSYYLPFQHLMMFLSLVGLASAVSALVTRWDSFSRKPFSPAHVAFCFPTLSHTNAIQAYRGAVNAFSNFAPAGPFKVALFAYWLAFLVGGTILNLIFTYMYIKRLPGWTKLEDRVGEDEPPAPEDTFVHEMLDHTEAHELLDQPFVSPAVLQANEAGALVRIRRGTADFRIHGPYVRTRKVTALGFDPTMDDEELRRERAELLDWVAKNAPRKRNRTMSNPLFLQQALVGSGGGHTGRDELLYGTFGTSIGGRHKRSVTTTQIPGV